MCSICVDIDVSFDREIYYNLSVVAHAYTPSTWEAEV